MFVGVSISGVTPNYERLDFVQAESPISAPSLQTKPVILDNSRVRLVNDHSELYRIKRFATGQGCLIWIGLYKHAYEMHRQRGGGYLSAGVWLQDCFIDGAIVVEYLGRFVSAVESACMRNGEFVTKLEVNRKVFADDFAPYLSEFRKRTESLPKTAAGAPFDDTLVYYDVHGMGGQIEGFLVSFLQASRCHRGLADVAFSNSRGIASASRQLSGIRILNESDIVRREWSDDREALVAGSPDKIPPQARAVTIGERLGLNKKPESAEPDDMSYSDTKLIKQISSELRRLDSDLKDMKLNERRFASKRDLVLLIIGQFVMLMALVILLRKDFALSLIKLLGWGS